MTLISRTRQVLPVFAGIAILSVRATVCIAPNVARADVATPATPAIPAAPAVPGGRAPRPEGVVASVTPTGFTVTNRRGDTITVTTDAKTKYSQITLAPLSSLTTGESIVVNGKLDDAGTTIVAHGIWTVTTGEKAAKNAVAGTVASTTPTLTLTTSDNKTITVTTQPNDRVQTRAEASASAVVVGAHVRVEGKEDEAASTPTFAAHRVNIMTGDLPTEAAHQHKNKKNDAVI